MRLGDREQRKSLHLAADRELRLLEEVEDSPRVSQRHLANRLGIALGVANLLVRALTKKGYIRATQVGWKRWVYVLTPAGIARKANLTFGYVERFVDHYRRVRVLLRDDLGALAMDPESPIAIYGTTDLAELIYLALRDMGLTRIDFYDHDGRESDFLGMSVESLRSVTPGNYAKVMVAFSTSIDTRCQELRANGFGPDQIVTLLQRPKDETDSAAVREQADDVPVGNMEPGA